MALASSLKFPAERAGYKIVKTRFLGKYEIFNTSNLGLRSQFLRLINLIFLSESGFNYYIFRVLQLFKGNSAVFYIL